MDQEKNVLSGRQNAPDVVDNIELTCFELAQDYINALTDPDEIKTNNGLFVDMLKHIYKTYLIDIIGNNKKYANRYDFKLLDKVFDIYTSLVYRYKANKRPSMIEFGLFTHIDSNTIYHAMNGTTKKLTSDDIEMVKRWSKECENQLTNGSSVFEIFLLKSQYRYNDNLAPVPIESQGPALSVGELPDLSGDNVQKIAKNDPKLIDKKG